MAERAVVVFDPSGKYYPGEVFSGEAEVSRMSRVALILPLEHDSIVTFVPCYGRELVCTRRNDVVRSFGVPMRLMGGRSILWAAVGSSEPLLQPKGELRIESFTGCGAVARQIDSPAVPLEEAKGRLVASGSAVVSNSLESLALVRLVAVGAGFAIDRFVVVH